MKIKHIYKFCDTNLLMLLAQDGWCQAQGYPLQWPLTSLSPEDASTALEINKLVSTSPLTIQQIRAQQQCPSQT